MFQTPEEQNLQSGSQNAQGNSQPGSNLEATVPAQPSQQIPPQTNSTTQPVENSSGGQNFLGNLGQTLQNAAQDVTKGVAEVAQTVTTEGMKAVGDAVQQTTGQQANQPNQQVPAQNAPEFKVANDEKLFAMISYIPMVAIVALVIKPESAFVRLHARQGLMTTLFVFLFAILTPIFMLFGFLGFVFVFFVGVASFALFVLIIYSMYLAITGVWWKIPVLNIISDKIPVELFAKVTKEAIKDNVVQATQDFQSRNEAQKTIENNNNQSNQQ